MKRMIASFFIILAVAIGNYANIAAMLEDSTPSIPVASADEDLPTHTPSRTANLIKIIQSGWHALSGTAHNFRKEQERAKWQNTVVLADPKVPVALYNRDLVELPLFATDVALAYWFFHQLKQNRIEYIYTEMTNNADWYLEQFQKLALLDRTAVEIQSSDRSFSEKFDLREELVKRATATLDEIAMRHHYLGTNPFKKEILGPLVAALAGHQLTRAAKGTLLAQQSFAPEALFGYKRDGTVFNLDTMWQPSFDGLNNAYKAMQDQPPCRYTPATRNGWTSENTRITNPALQKQLSALAQAGKTPAQIIEEMPTIGAIYEAGGSRINRPIAQANGYSHIYPKGFIAIREPFTPEETIAMAANTTKASNALLKEAIKGLCFWHGAPMSITSFIRSFFIANPNAPTLDYGPPIQRTLENFGNGVQYVIPAETINKAWYKMLGFPSWYYPLMYNSYSGVILRGAVMIASIYITNASYHKEWIITVAKEYPEIQTLLIAHKATAHLPETDPDKQLVAHTLKKLIARGNMVTSTSIRSAVTEFFRLKLLSEISVNGKMNQWIFTLFNAYVTTKIARYLYTAFPHIKTAYRAGWINFDSFFSTPIGPLALIYGIYFGGMYTGVALGAGLHVVDDIKTIYRWAKHRFSKSPSDDTKEAEKELEESKEPMEETHEPPTI